MSRRFSIRVYNHGNRRQWDYFVQECFLEDILLKCLANKEWGDPGGWRDISEASAAELLEAYAFREYLGNGIIERMALIRPEFEIHLREII